MVAHQLAQNLELGGKSLLLRVHLAQLFDQQFGDVVFLLRLIDGLFVIDDLGDGRIDQFFLQCCVYFESGQGLVCNRGAGALVGATVLIP